MANFAESSQSHPLRPVTSNPILIAEPDSISPDLSPRQSAADVEHVSQQPSSPKHHRTSTKRLSGRLPNKQPSPSLHSISSISSHESNLLEDGANADTISKKHKQQHRVRHPAHASYIISQVADWLASEKAKKSASKATRHKGLAKLTHDAEATKSLTTQFRSDKREDTKPKHRRRSSELSEGSLALEKLEQILSTSLSFGKDEDMATPTGDKEKGGSYFPRRKSTRKGSKNVFKKSSMVHLSDSDQQDAELLVPSAEVVLDNSKTLGYSGGIANSDVDLHSTSKRVSKEKEAWLLFKKEIVRLTHTLRISGWRRVPLDCGGDIEVERLSGALTNAVYVVSPPKNLPQTPAITKESMTSLLPKKAPPKLLLRIYGPQVEHLIDRESELQILRRLARKSIGPRLLGTFTNGRFEQFFHARTLTAKDLRIPDTSKQIAKRMRELHDGIELLEEERLEGPFVWRNWDKWVNRCHEVISWLDSQMLAHKQDPARSCIEACKDRGLICGVEWSFFRRTVEVYRKWLHDEAGGAQQIRQDLVFAHNDTQYGNLLRLEPSGESPLLLPANEHKQLIVIDFEYASANVPGLEFANHFTEWCYDYHDKNRPFALKSNRYPTREEQYRFIKAYVQHHPPTQPRSGQTPITPGSMLTPGASSSISSFVLDSRAPPGQYGEDESRRDEALESEIQRLMHETRLWRLANSAQWVLWGIVQAKIPGMDEALEAQKNATPTPASPKTDSEPASTKHLHSDSLSPETAGLAENAHNKRPESREDVPDETPEEEEEEEEFDYLGYAQERAMFFWGDVLQLGIVKREDLPAELLEKAKVVEY